MELSTEHQSIDQCMLKYELIKQTYLMIVDMMCRSELYQSIEQKILMGGTTVRNSDTMKACLTEEQSVYTNIKVIEHLISKRFYYLRAFNKELYSLTNSFQYGVVKTVKFLIDPAKGDRRCALPRNPILRRNKRPVLPGFQ
ncbi:hypothetical protein MS3_00008983 [Schistosoma haematobium]|uniref:Uncharacterized protein n=1 Tax=Schistosoma haematobium TaxID=6185 RepID=A0A922III3_SCHHA|nr:hypothetical protein MS3_00008983 [Schistosoma haematobium]KAH9580293.1 hypothetical protein MS3_00008983 [Schistosoma haematobium]